MVKVLKYFCKYSQIMFEIRKIIVIESETYY